MKRKNYCKKDILDRRHKRIIKKIQKKGRNICLRVKKTNTHIYVFAIDHEKEKMLFSSSSCSLKLSNGNKKNTLLVAEDFCKKLKDSNIDALALDRGGHKFHGRIQLIAETLVQNGIKI